MKQVHSHEMATRTLESNKDRVLTILITPFMSCSAKLPIYILLAGIFFSARAGTVIFSIYITGIILSIITGRLFRSTLFKGADAPFVMELPPYRVPMIKSLVIHMWDRSKMFLKKMGGIILVGSIVVWMLAASLMVFVLLYLPCVATIATIRRETGSLKWTLFSITYSTFIAWTAAFCVYQGGKVLGLT